MVMSNNDRHSKALAILRRGGVVRQNNDMFSVVGNSGSNWRVTVWDDKHIQCSCPVNKVKRQECHHIIAVKNYLVSARTGWRMW